MSQGCIEQILTRNGTTTDFNGKSWDKFIVVNFNFREKLNILKNDGQSYNIFMEYLVLETSINSK